MKVLLVAVTLIALGAMHSSAANTPATDAFAKLKTLAGDWEGTFQWDSGRSGGPLKATYTLTGHGSALIETLTMDGGSPDSTSMSTVYHMDGADVRATHYCAAQNQPRLKSSALDVANGRFRFDFVDITNLASPDAGHMNAIDLHMIDANHITITFGYTQAGKISHELLTLARRTSSIPSSD